MKRVLFLAFIFLISWIFIVPVKYSFAGTFEDKLKGKILLQVESEGQAWYVDTSSAKRHFLGRPDDAFNVMRKLGVGISNKNLYKIPVGVSNNNDTDSDGDGLSDYLEKTLGLNLNNKDTDGDGYSDHDELVSGYNPWAEGVQNLDKQFAKKI